MSLVEHSLRVDRSLADGVVAQVSLARPDVRNALDGALVDSLRTTFESLSSEAPEHLRAVVLCGDGPTFSGGADIAWMREATRLDEAANRTEARALYMAFEAIDRCPVPVIARVHGGAIGGGAGLCAVSDVVVAEADTLFGFTETRLGIIPAVISPFVISKIGDSHARALFPGGERFGTEEAQRIGLIHRICVGEPALDAEVHKIVNGVLASGPVASRSAKALVRELRGLGADARAEHVAQRIASIRVSEEAGEGLQAFLEHRAAAWVRRVETREE